MTESDHRAADVIDAYRRRRNRMMPLLLGGLAVVLLVVGVFLIVVWLTGENPPSLPFLSTKTPTPTVTPTPLPSSATPTITMTPAPTQSPTASGPRTYIVEANDTLYSIAQKFSTTIDLLLAYNPKVTNPNNIPVGSQLIIPEPNAQLPTETPMQKTPIPGTRIDYTVKGGDTLQSIAARFNSTAEAIALASGIKVTDILFVGKVLKVPVGIATPTPTYTPNPNTSTPSGTATNTMVP